MQPSEIYRAAIRIYTQGTPCTPSVAVDIARRIAREIEAYDQAQAEQAPWKFRADASLGAAHGVADPEET